MSTKRSKRQIVLERVLAEGGHSVVHVGRDSSSLESVAVKVIDLSKDTAAALFNSEVKAMKRIPVHRNLPKMQGNCKTKSVASIVMTYFPFPTLESFIKSRGQVPEEEALFIIRQLIETIGALMHSGVAHRDIKSENILINPATLQIKLIDFGLACVKDNMNEHHVENQYVGTPIYMAPDLLKGYGVYKIIASELWSAGLVLWEMLLGHHPFHSVDTKRELLEMQRATKDFSSFGTHTQSVLHGLLAVKEADRISVKSCLRYLRENCHSPKLSIIVPLQMSRRSLSFSASFDLLTSSTRSSRSSASNSLSTSSDSGRRGN
jgi:serine/threonine protein kinase